VTGPERAGLASSIAVVAEVCRDEFARYADANGVPSGELNRWALLAIALFDTAGASVASVEDSDVRLMRDAASAAAAVCRTQIPNETALALAAAFARAECVCGEALGAVAVTSQRFLFADADVTVARTGERWRVRSGALEFEDPLLGSALALACSWLLPGRVGELALQILDWDAHVAPAAG
jgi:hypothetical protein